MLFPAAQPGRSSDSAIRELANLPSGGFVGPMSLKDVL